MLGSSSLKELLITFVQMFSSTVDMLLLIIELLAGEVNSSDNSSVLF